MLRLRRKEKARAAVWLAVASLALTGCSSCGEDSQASENPNARETPQTQSTGLRVLPPESNHPTQTNVPTRLAPMIRFRPDGGSGAASDAQP